MEDIFHELYPYVPIAEVSESDPEKDSSINLKYTRVLWDIENITPMSSSNPMYSMHFSSDSSNMTLKTIALLQNFLEKNKYAGNGIQCHITTFINMIESLSKTNSKGTDASYVRIDQHIILDLDKANIEILFCSKLVCVLIDLVLVVYFL